MKHITEGFDFNSAINDIDDNHNTYNEKVYGDYVKDQTAKTLQWIKDNASIYRVNDIKLEYSRTSDNYIDLYNITSNNKRDIISIEFDFKKYNKIPPFIFDEVKGDISLKFYNIKDNVEILPYTISDGGPLSMLTIKNCTLLDPFQNINHPINYENANITISNSALNTLKGLKQCNNLVLRYCDNITDLNDYIPVINESLVIEYCNNFKLTPKLINSVSIPDLQTSNIDNLDKETCKVLNNHNTTFQYYKSEFNDPSIIDLKKVLKGFRESIGYNDYLNSLFDNYHNCDGEEVVIELEEIDEIINTDAEIHLIATCEVDQIRNEYPFVSLDDIKLEVEGEDMLKTMSKEDIDKFIDPIIVDIEDTIFEGYKDEMDKYEDYGDDDYDDD